MSFWQPTSKLKTAARAYAKSLLFALFDNAARATEGERPRFYVVDSSPVTASDLRSLSTSSCPHCSRVSPVYNPSHASELPDIVYVDVTVAVPIHMLPVRYHRGANEEELAIMKDEAEKYKERMKLEQIDRGKPEEPETSSSPKPPTFDPDAIIESLRL